MEQISPTFNRVSPWAGMPVVWRIFLAFDLPTRAKIKPAMAATKAKMTDRVPRVFVLSIIGGEG
jgi:hypothetical protein